MTDILERLRESAECADYVIDREVAYDASCAIKTLRASELRLLGQVRKLSEETTQLRAALQCFANAGKMAHAALGNTEAK